MRLTIVGCAGSFPAPGSAASCYLVEHEDCRIVLDLGSGALGPLAAATDLRAIDAVLLTHLHPDHCLDLTGLHVALSYHPEGPPPRRLPVHGPHRTGRRIADAYRADGADPIDSLARVFDFREHAETYRLGAFTIRTVRVAHPVPAFAFRVEAGGRSLVYSGDTGTSPALVELATGADLALFEASFLSGEGNPDHVHLTAAEAASHAREAGVGRLILTHLVSWNDPLATLAEARTVYEGQLGLAAAGMVVEV